MDTFNLLGQAAIGSLLGFIEARYVDNGDILTCPDRCCAALVMGSSIECDANKLHLVKEGETWGQRETINYPVDMHLYVVRPKG